MPNRGHTVPPLAARERPGLSETLPHRALGITHCWACGVLGALQGDGPLDLERWLEADPWDRYDRYSPVVILCPPCARREIQRHPRLYAPLAPYEPKIGAMPLCLGCAHQRGASCASPELRANGGAGIAIDLSQRIGMFIKCGRPARSGFTTLYRAWPASCSGRSDF